MALGVLRELITRLGFTVDDAEARRYENRIRKIGQTARQMGRTLSLYVTAPIVGLGVGMVKAAADAEETENKFYEVFKGIEEQAKLATQSLTNDFDLATDTAQDLLSSTGDILVGFGFTRKAALDLSKQVNELSVDIASFKNVQGGAAQASNAITKSLLGEREMLKGIGIAILEADVKAKILQLRQEGMTFETERQAKAFATLQIVMERSADAIGDYARTADSTTNRARKLRQRFRELAVTFGKELLPVVSELLGHATNLLKWLNDMSPNSRRAIIAIAGITAALGPLLVVLGSILGIITAIPLAIPLAIAGIAALGYLIGEDLAAFIRGDKSVIGLLIDNFKDAVLAMISEIGQAAREMLEGLFPEIFAKSPGETELEGRAEFRRQQVRRLQQLTGQAPSVFTSGEELGRQIAHAEARSAMGEISLADTMAALNRPAMAADLRPQGDTTVNAEVTINLPPGTTASDVTAITGEEIQRATQEARNRGIIAPRFAP